MVLGGIVKAGIKGGKRAVRKTDPAAALRIAKSNFTDQKLLGPTPLREQMVRNPEQVASGAEQALIQYNTPIWTDAKTGDVKHIRNYGSKVMKTQGMPLQVNDAVNRVNTRGNQPGQNRADNILATTEGKQDFGTYRGDEGFPKTKSEVAKILNIPIELVEQHHAAGAAHWGWLFKGTTKDQAFEMHRILEEAGIVLGNKRYNRIDIPVAVHNVLHRALEAQDLLPKKGDFSKIPFDQRKVYLQEMITDQRFVDEITYDIMSQYQTGVPIENIKFNPKKTKPTQFPEQIQRHITRSQEIGITEPTWKSGSIDYTWRPETNTGQIDIPPQSAKGFKGLRDEFFEQIEDLPSGSVWELNPKFKDEKRRRIYARLFTGDPRITRNADETLGWVLTVP